jgi:oligogalacturonide lyase
VGAKARTFLNFMNMRILFLTNLIACLSIVFSPSLCSQIGTRFPSEMKVVTDPDTGIQLTFLTSGPAGDSKIYQTHRQWSADGKWVIFRSNRVRGEAMAVNEKTGLIVQVSEGGFTGMLNVARKSMKLYFMRFVRQEPGQSRNRPVQVIEVDLEKLFADSEAGQLKSADSYQRSCGTTPAELGAGRRYGA